MKIRQSFVSNSSSSSFVLFVEKKTCKEVMESLTPFQKSIVEQLRVGNDKFMDAEFAVFEEFDNQGYTTWEDVSANEDLLNKDESDDKYVAWEVFTSKLPKEKFLSHSVDM